MTHIKHILPLVFAALVLISAPAFAQKPAAPVDTAKLPTLTLHHAGKAKESDKAIGKTDDGDIIYRGSRGGLYYWKGDTKKYLNAKQKEAIGE